MFATGRILPIRGFPYAMFNIRICGRCGHRWRLRSNFAEYRATAHNRRGWRAVPAEDENYVYAIWVPDAPHEAMRDLVRAREAAVRDSRMKRQQVSAMMLRHGRIYAGKKSWSAKRRRWLADQNLGHRASDIALGEALQAVADAETRQKRG